MKVGLLWYDDDPSLDLAEKIGQAARRYRQKFGTPPNICYVHPSVLSGNASLRQGSVQATKLSASASTKLVLSEAEGLSASGQVEKVGGVRVASKPSVLRHHFCVGREEERRGRRTVKSKQS